MWHPRKVSRVSFLPKNGQRKTPIGQIKIKSHPRRDQFSLKIKILNRDQHHEKLETLTRNSIFQFISKLPSQKNKNKITLKITIYLEGIFNKKFNEISRLPRVFSKNAGGGPGMGEQSRGLFFKGVNLLYFSRE